MNAVSSRTLGAVALSLAILATVPVAAAPAGTASLVDALEPDPATPALAAMDAVVAGSGLAPPATERTYPRTPADRYDLAGGCYAVRSLSTGRFVAAAPDGFAATADQADDAEPFRFQATDLGHYLLYASGGDFLAASDSPLGAVSDAATGSTPGGVAGGLTLGATDRIAAAVGDGAAADATGRGAAVVSAAEPSELADWRLDQRAGHFVLVLPSAGAVLSVAEDGTLVMAPPDRAGSGALSFERVDGCATYPEVRLNIDGPVATGPAPHGEVRGFLDAHLHMMAFEFLGGRARCGRPWHRYGVTHALVDCPDHEPGGAGAVLENVLADGAVPVHDTVGWPTFGYWPRYDSLTHEQVYYKWLERAWRGGLRMVVNLLVDNNVLCEVYPHKRHGCNEMDGVRRQAERIRELERYIDAQSGGPGEGWLRIVTDPFEARRVMNSGRLAVVLGIEVSVLFDCGVFAEIARCDTAEIDQRLDEVHSLGVRQMEFVNKFDNALAGVAGDDGSTGVVVNNGNFIETGKFWQLETCGESDGHAHDRTQPNLHDDAGRHFEEFAEGHGHDAPALTSRDALAGGILEVAGRSGAAPVYPQAPHCNVRGLTTLGEHLIHRMAAKGMIFDPDHMSARARRQALDVVEDLGYSGVVSSHGWGDPEAYPRIYRAGGVVTPYAGSSTGFVADWRQHKQWADPRYFFGFGYGADTNGFGSQGAPRGADEPNPVTYPFRGFGGVTVGQQRSGERTYDINVDGVAHYGLYPDWIEDLRRLAGEDIVEDLARGPEAYLQMWERALGIAPDACRSDVADLEDVELAQLRKGMSPEAVLVQLGQPVSRRGGDFTYCLTHGRRATVSFDADGGATHVHRSRAR